MSVYSSADFKLIKQQVILLRPGLGCLMPILEMTLIVVLTSFFN